MSDATPSPAAVASSVEPAAGRAVEARGAAGRTGQLDQPLHPYQGQQPGLADGADTGALASVLRLSVMRFARRLRSERSDDTHTLTQLSALATVNRHGPLTPGALAALERVRPPSMTRVLSKLEEEGLVARAAHPTDGRQVVVSITTAGEALLLGDRRRRDAWLARQLVDLTDDERHLLEQVAPLLDRLACR